MHRESSLCLQRAPIRRDCRDKNPVADLEVPDEFSYLNNFADRLMTEDHILSITDRPRPNRVYVGGTGSQCNGLADGIYRTTDGRFLFDPAGLADSEHCESFHYNVFLSFFIIYPEIGG